MFHEKKARSHKTSAILAFVCCHFLLGFLPERAFASLSYVTDIGNGIVYAINTATNEVTAEIINTFTPFQLPVGVAFSPDRTTAYVTDNGSQTVYVIDVATHTVTAEISNSLPQTFIEPYGNRIFS